MNPIFTDAGHGHGGDNLAPSITDPTGDPENTASGEYQWRIKTRPDESEAEIVYAPTPYEDEVEQYDHGTHHVAEFQADVPGTYVLELAGPDGTHELTIHARPAGPAGAGGPPYRSRGPLRRRRGRVRHSASSPESQRSASASIARSDRPTRTRSRDYRRPSTGNPDY